jgi:predicted kinase
VYRALVRAKVAALHAGGEDVSPAQRQTFLDDCRDHLKLADQFTAVPAPCLWITHGLSGSGKTVGSEYIVQRDGAIRFRSDIERKRHFGFAATYRPTAQQRKQWYSAAATNATYERLLRQARSALGAGYPIVVDAAFLKTAQRQRFRQLAESLGVRFAILDFQAKKSVLRQRIAARNASGSDASDADLDVLESQIASQEPLTADEAGLVAQLPAAQVT